MEVYPQREIGILSEPSLLAFLLPALPSPNSEESIAGRRGRGE